MSAKDVKFGIDARNKMLRGVDECELETRGVTAVVPTYPQLGTNERRGGGGETRSGGAAGTTTETS